MSHAKKLQSEIEATLMRNLDVLVEDAKRSMTPDQPSGDPKWVRFADMRAMLKSSAANLAQVLAADFRPTSSSDTSGP